MRPQPRRRPGCRDLLFPPWAGRAPPPGLGRPSELPGRRPRPRSGRHWGPRPDPALTSRKMDSPLDGGAAALSSSDELDDGGSVSRAPACLTRGRSIPPGLRLSPLQPRVSRSRLPVPRPAPCPAPVPRPAPLARPRTRLSLGGRPRGEHTGPPEAPARPRPQGWRGTDGPAGAPPARPAVGAESPGSSNSALHLGT